MGRGHFIYFCRKINKVLWLVLVFLENLTGTLSLTAFPSQTLVPQKNDFHWKNLSDGANKPDFSQTALVKDRKMRVLETKKPQCCTGIIRNFSQFRWDYNTRALRDDKIFSTERSRITFATPHKTKTQTGFKNCIIKLHQNNHTCTYFDGTNCANLGSAGNLYIIIVPFKRKN